MEACSWKVVTKVVGRSELFQRTMEEETKSVPLTVRVKAGPPAVALEGESDVIAGTGLFTVRLTETLCGLFEAAGSETLMLPVKLAAASPAMLVETVKLVELPAATLPLMGLTLSQPAGVLAAVA